MPQGGFAGPLPRSNDMMRANVNQALGDIAAGTKRYPKDFSTFGNYEGSSP
ncbi:MAG: hypothetical protein M3198_09340 [Actinomycetota bacterium]|nr:hypothetical protein [Actinomycetota bacterium]